MWIVYVRLLRQLAPIPHPLSVRESGAYRLLFVSGLPQSVYKDEDHDSFSLLARLAARSVAACQRCAFVFLLSQFFASSFCSPSRFHAVLFQFCRPPLFSRPVCCLSVSQLKAAATSNFLTIYVYSSLNLLFTNNTFLNFANKLKKNTFIYLYFFFRLNFFKFFLSLLFRTGSPCFNWSISKFVFHLCLFVNFSLTFWLLVLCR